ncbi:hypothetical protein JOE11_005530 [Robbsia andropogonis]|uniref:hypothetical protein n=1 Tax=Robbsia andropogonis TaxID=28092 RepID=UPI003D22550C
MERIVSMGLFGRLRGTVGDFLSFERTPLLLSKNEESVALARRAVWIDEPTGWFATDGSDVDALGECMPEYVAPYFFLASNTQSCWKRGQCIPVFCVSSKGDYLARYVFDREDEQDESTEGVVWTIAYSGTFIRNLIVSRR